MSIWDTPQGKLGAAAESVVRAWLANTGWWVLPTSLIEDGGAPAFKSWWNENVIVPNNLAAKEGRMRWIEVKGKTQAMWVQRLGQHQHGIADRLWRNYLECITLSGTPGALVVVEFSTRVLLYCGFDVLGNHLSYPVSDAGYDEPMVFFPRDVFQRFEVPPNEDLPPGLPVATPRAWDRAPSKEQQLWFGAVDKVR